MDIKAEIFSILDEIQAKTAALKGADAVLGRQTDLEIAILKKQIKDLKDVNQAGATKINQALSILKALK